MFPFPHANSSPCTVLSALQHASITAPAARATCSLKRNVSSLGVPSNNKNEKHSPVRGLSLHSRSNAPDLGISRCREPRLDCHHAGGRAQAGKMIDALDCIRDRSLAARDVVASQPLVKCALCSKCRSQPRVPQIHVSRGHWCAYQVQSR